MPKNEKEDLIRKYKECLSRELGVHEDAFEKKQPPKADAYAKKYSSNYEQFKQESVPKKLTIYEKLCNISVRIISINPGKKRFDELSKLVYLSHINASPNATVSFS